MKQFFGKKSRNALATVLLVSLALHVVAILIFGTIKFVSEALREETVFEAAPVEVAPQQQPEYTVNIQQLNQSTPPQQPSTIVVNNPSALDIPTLEIDVNIESSAVFERPAGDFSGGLSSVREMAVSGNLFGAKISSNKLGVVLDVSGSAHAHLQKAIDEIDRNFPRAYIVLVVGCGMSDGTEVERIAAKSNLVPGKPRIVPYNRRGENEKYDSIVRSVAGQLAKLGVGQEKGKELERNFKRRDNLYMLYGADILGANFAFDFLLQQNADTIYWFADFADRIDDEVLEKLGANLRRQRVKVVAHNFMGRGIPEKVEAVVQKTGGTSISLIPGSSG